MTQVSYLELNDYSVEDYRSGRGLSKEHKMFLTNNGLNLWMNSFVLNIKPDFLESLDESFCACENERDHFRGDLTGWLENERFFLGIRLRREISLGHLVDDFVSGHGKEKFMLLYVLRFPEKVEVNNVRLNGHQEYVHFLMRANVIDPQNKDYLRILGIQ